jgi:hypothetical protein
MVGIQQYLREFLNHAEAIYPELVSQDKYAELLVTLYGSTRLILSQTSFNRWVYEKSEVELFLQRRIRLERYDIHVKGSRIGHYKIMLYENEEKVFEYVEIEFIGHGGNVATNQKVFRVTKDAEVPPLGEVVSTLLMFEIM